MRTHEEFQKEFLAAHDCEKCHGKIVAIQLDKMGLMRCGYCNEVVNYPKATMEELESWMQKKRKCDCSDEPRVVSADLNNDKRCEMCNCIFPGPSSGGPNYCSMCCEEKDICRYCGGIKNG